MCKVAQRVFKVNVNTQHPSASSFVSTVHERGAVGLKRRRKVLDGKEPVCSCCWLINQRANMPNHNPTWAHGASRRQTEQFDWLLRNGFSENVNVDSECKSERGREG